MDRLSPIKHLSLSSSATTEQIPELISGKRLYASPIVAGLLCATIIGCAPVQRCVDTGLRYAEAKQAYQACPAPPLCRGESRHFERGWRAGYADVASGRSGRAPVVPPEQYWRHRYETAEGRQLVALWYQGYGAGSEAARQCGRSTYHKVPAHACQSFPSCYGGQGVLPPPRLAMTQQWSQQGMPVEAVRDVHIHQEYEAPAAAPQIEDSTEDDAVEVLKALPPLSE